MNRPHQDQVAIVTGAARGFGRAIAQRLAADGATVVVADRRAELALATADGITQAGGRALAVAADIAQPEAVTAMVQRAVDAFGTVDVLVNNAGFMPRTSPAETIPLDEWHTTMAVNVTAVFLCMQAVLPILRAKGRGRIVNIASSAGRQTSTFCGAHYTASKAAVLGLTRHVAREYAAHGITINAIAPGTFLTDGAKEEMAKAGLTEAHLDAARQLVPMRRFGLPHEVADLVAFLASPQAAYITGATMDINGGELMM